MNTNLMMRVETLLINEIGLDINENEVLIDQDLYNNLIQFNGRNVKYNLSGNPSISKSDVLLEIGNTKLIVSLFSYYIDKLQKLENKYYPIYFPNICPDGSGRTSLTIKSNTETITSNYYFNESLKFIDIIYRLGGTVIDLSQYDSIIQ